MKIYICRQGLKDWPIDHTKVSPITAPKDAVCIYCLSPNSPFNPVYEITELDPKGEDEK